jgi:streptogramin lyase
MRSLLAPAVAVVGALLAAIPAARAQSILVGDFGGSKVVECTYPSGVAETHFVGANMTTLNGLAGMTFGPDGNLYMCSYNTSTIIRVNGQNGFPFGSTSIFVNSATSGGLNHPTALTWGPDGKLYVSSQTTNSVFRYNPDGSFVDTFIVAGSGTLAAPWGLAFRAGNLYVVSNTNAKVLRYNGTTGAFLGEEVTAAQAGLSLPRGLLFDTVGRMYVTGGNAVYVKDGANFTLLASNATIPGLIGTDQLNLTPDGTALMIPCHNGTVQKVDPMTGASLGVLVLNGAGGMTATLESVLVLPPVCGSSDFNGDGDFGTDADIEAFYRVLAGGHC